MIPRWLARLLERAVAEVDRDEVVGDVEEIHRARRGRWGAVPATLATSVEGLGLALAHGTRRGFAGLRAGSWSVSAIEARLALRLVVKQPVMTVTAVAALGIGIGIATGGFSVLRQGLFSELPWDDGDRWVVIETYTEDTRTRSRMDLERLRAFRSAATSFAYIGGAEALSLNVVSADGSVERVSGARVTPGTFAHLPYVPVAGRLLVPADGAPGAEPVVLIRESYGERAFDGADAAVGRAIDIGGTDHRVVGVLPDHAGYPSEGELWLPLDEETMGAAHDRDALAGTRQTAILGEGVTIAQAAEQLARISSAVAASERGAEAHVHVVTPITRTIASGSAYSILWLVTGILLAFLSVIAANVANLVSARTALRSSELAVRSALGASRSRIVTQLLAETLALVTPAALLGLALAGWVLSLYDRMLDELPFWVRLHVDPTTAATVLAFALVAAVILGVAPALRATRSAPGSTLLRAGRSTVGIGRLGGAMIAAEVAISVALLGTGVVFAQGFRAYIDPVVELPDERVLTARLTLGFGEDDLAPGGAETLHDSTATLLASLNEALRSIPGARAVGFTTHLPRSAPMPEPIEVEGRPDLVSAGIAQQGPGVFEVLEVEPERGRDLVRGDGDPDAPPVVVVNRAFALEAFGTTQVLGRRVRPAPDGPDDADAPWRTIVGVVPDVMEVTATGPAAALYLPLGAPRFVSAAVLVDGEPVALTGSLRRRAFDLDPDLVVSDVVRLDQVGAENRTALQAMSGVVAAVGLTTLLLSLAGVYSIVSLAVTRRTREIGVRVALGAEPASILRSVLGRTTLLVTAGGVLGAAAGWVFSGARLFVFALPEPAPWLFPALVASMAVVAGLACWVPVRRALSIRPGEALSHD